MTVKADIDAQVGNDPSPPPKKKQTKTTTTTTTTTKTTTKNTQKSQTKQNSNTPPPQKKRQQQQQQNCGTFLGHHGIGYLDKNWETVNYARYPIICIDDTIFSLTKKSTLSSGAPQTIEPGTKWIITW